MRKVPKLHLEFYQRDITDGALSPWKLPVGVVSESFLEVVKVAQVQPVVGPILHSSAMEDVDHDVWRALLTEIRQRGAHALNCSVTECVGIQFLVMSYQRSREQKWNRVRVSTVSARTISRTQIAISA